MFVGLRFQMDPELYEKAKARAVEEDRTLTGLIRRALRKELGLKPNPRPKQHIEAIEQQ
jgi:hypothetical protein